MGACMDTTNYSPKFSLLIFLLLLLSLPSVSTAQKPAASPGAQPAAAKQNVEPPSQSNVQAPASSVKGPFILENDPTFESSPRAAATKNFVLNHTEISVTDFGAVGDGKADNRTA